MMCKKKFSAKSAVSVIVAVVMLCIAMATTAFAVSVGDFTWFQDISSYTVDLGSMAPGDNINLNGIEIYFVATSPEAGQFQVVLQRRVFLNLWQNVDGDLGYRTAAQSHARRYDTLNGEYVNGEVNLLCWSTTQSGDYRVIMEDATNEQATVISRFKAWTYGPSD